MWVIHKYILYIDIDIYVIRYFLQSVSISTTYQNCFPFFFKGKLEALAILLQKLKSDGRRVLIFTQMVKMLDILEAFLDHRKLSYVRVDESFTPQERQVWSPSK